MNKLDPGRSVPIVWALTEILGLSITDIQQQSRVSRFALYQMQDGSTDGRAHVQTLASLAKRMLAEISKQSANDLVMGKDEFKSFRLAAYAAVKLAIEKCGEAPPVDQPRETELSTHILQHLPVKGALRIDVVRALKGLYRPRAIERAAKRIGVKELSTDKGRWWVPPRDLASIATVSPTRVKYTKPRTRLQRKVVGLILDMLKSTPDGMPPDDVLTRCAHLTLSRALVYRLARYANVRRRTTGFGPTKRTLWLYPVGDE